MCGCVGRPRTLTFHLTGATVPGAAAAEVRTGPRMERPFLIRSLSWVPSAATGPGQFVDLLVSSDDDTSDTATPTGSSIFQGPQNVSGLPAGDADIGLPVADVPFEVPTAFRVEATGKTLKVVARFQAPSTAPPAGHVVLVVDEFDIPAPPISVRPPVVPAPPPVAPPVGGGDVPPVQVPAPTAPPSVPTPNPRVPASWPNLVAMGLSNCIPRELGVIPRTGAGPGGAVCPPRPGGASSGAVVSSLPAGLQGASAELAQRYVARVVP